MVELFNRTLILTPHCDDETIGCGGLIHKLHRTNPSSEIYILVFARDRSFSTSDSRYVSIEERSHEMKAALKKLGGNIKVDFLPESEAPQTAGNLTAFLTIQEGCDKFCSFCVVPYTRGAENSRPVASVMAEARRMVAGGVRDISLLGQNVNAYHGVGPDGDIWGLGSQPTVSITIG